jgi:LmbE family N-acetylglucosaminyl deacetylase
VYGVVSISDVAMRKKEESDFLQPDRVLFIVAHPDDPEFGSGGTTARWVRGGTQVTYVIVTDGGKGSNDRELTGEELVQIRQAEQRAAAQVLGVSKVVFLRYPDGHVYNTPELRRDLVRQIRLHRPDLVVTHDPTVRFIGSTYINHPDHRAVGDTALDAVFPLARDRFNFPEHEREGLSPHKVLDVFLTPTNEPNEWVDISETLELKIAALREHRSQIGDLEALAARVRQRAEYYAEGTPFTYAERFRHITLRR